jgi:RNA polymerase sigma-70 factor (ECF subfamily)
VPALDDMSLERIDALVDAGSFHEAIRAALLQLSDKEREAIRLRVLDDQPYSAVAAALGCSEGAARVRVHRGLARLSHLLEVPACPA